jgi:hypothetical protein
MSIMDPRLAVAVLASLIGGLLVVPPPAAGQAIAYKEPGGNVKIARGIDKVTQEADSIDNTGVSNAVTLGRISDLDDDGTLEVPAIIDGNNNGVGDLVLIEPDGSTEIENDAAEFSRAALGVGDGPAGASTNGKPEIIYRATSPGKVSLFTSPSQGTEEVEL